MLQKYSDHILRSLRGSVRVPALRTTTRGGCDDAHVRQSGMDAPTSAFLYFGVMLHPDRDEGRREFRDVFAGS